MPRSAASATRGDNLAELELIYSAKAEQVFRLALRLTGHQPDAEDVTQQVFLRLLSTMNSETPIERLDPFLTKLAICATRDLQRSAYSRRKREESRLHSRTTERDPTVHTEEPAGVLQDLETYQAVQAALQELPEKLREPLVLHYMEEHSKQDVASLLSLPLSTVCLRLDTGLKKLRARLQHAQVPVAAVAPAVLLARAGQVMPCKADLGRIWKAIQDAPVAEVAKPGGLFARKVACAAGLILLLAVVWLGFAPDDMAGHSEIPADSTGQEMDRSAANFPSTEVMESKPGPIELDFGGEAMAFGKGRLWISVAGKPQLIQIDAQTGTRTADLDLSHIIARRIGGIAWSPEGALWINDMETGKLFRVLPESRKVEREFALGFNPAGMTWLEGNLFVVDSTRLRKSRICRIDPASGKVTRQLPIATPLDVPVSTFSLAYMAGGLWLGTSGSGTPMLYKLSIETGKVTMRAKLTDPVRVQSLALDDKNRLWVLTRGERSTLMRMDVPAEMSFEPGNRP